MNAIASRTILLLSGALLLTTGCTRRRVKLSHPVGRSSVATGADPIGASEYREAPTAVEVIDAEARARGQADGGSAGNSHGPVEGVRIPYWARGKNDGSATGDDDAAGDGGDGDAGAEPAGGAPATSAPTTE